MRSDPFICLSTHLITQFSSRELRDLVVKSLTQLSKHDCTILPYVWARSASVVKRSMMASVEFEGGHKTTYAHELSHLLHLHSTCQLALLGLVQPTTRRDQLCNMASDNGTYESMVTVRRQKSVNSLCDGSKINQIFV